MRRLTALLLLAASSVQAQGTGEAAVMLDGQTLFLSADNANSAVPMVACDGDGLHLTFAQLHLRFPMPPFLHVALNEGPDGWQVETLRLDRTGSAPDVFVTPSEARITEFAVVDDGTMRATLSGNGMVPATPLGSQILPLEVDLSLTCPAE